MLYVQLDTNWPDHRKIIQAGVEGAGAHAIILCLAKRLEDDGWVSGTLLRRYDIDTELINRLRSAGLLEVDDVAFRVRPWGWHDRNPSQAAISATRATKRDAARRGNHQRWHPGVEYDKCDKCQVIAGSDRTGSHELSTGSDSDRVLLSRGIAEVEVTPATPEPVDSFDVMAQISTTSNGDKLLHPLAARALTHTDPRRTA